MIIREATLSDAEAIAKVYVDCWKTTYKNIVPDSFLNNLSYDKRKQYWNFNISNRENYIFVAVNDKSEIVGFTVGCKEKTGKYKDYLGEVTSLFVLEKYQRTGIGKELLQNLFVRLNNLQLSTVLVWMLEENNACSFYENLGAKLIDTQTLDFPKMKLKAIAYGWDEITSIIS